MRRVTGRETRLVCLLTPFFSIRDKCQLYFESSFIVTLTISLTLTREIRSRCVTCDLLTICTLLFLRKLHFLQPLYCRFYYCYFSFRNLFCNRAVIEFLSFVGAISCLRSLVLFLSGFKLLTFHSNSSFTTTNPFLGFLFTSSSSIPINIHIAELMV